MSTSAPTVLAPNAPDARIAIIDTLWNQEIVSALTSGAVATLLAHEVKQENIHVYHVPGAVELTYAAMRLMEQKAFDAIIINGCVVRGGTPHFDYVCQSVTHGMTELNLRGEIPVIFGVLTVDNEQQALDRAGGCLGNKGSECAEAALHMISL
ncbi:MAG: 6,7-dimethyl-8-ribityllumazine synthase [Bacteroidales bacterium]|nr:6,7-dimethyl-8-ribityllumazine synthase [Bacteroidales bacterium]MCD8394377.1 6,7-dimethyl-8-ribityllumazine synthase [Bacteroidales bacterium]